MVPTTSHDAPSTPSTVSPAKGEVAELRTTLEHLQATVATLVEQAHTPATPGGTPETDQASRIIVMANRTAESTLDEARAEAADLLASAQAHSVEILAAARELADQELAAERVRVAAATAEWTARRVEISAHLRELEAALSGYRDGLGDTAEAIREAAARLEAERADPPVIDELPAPDPAAFVGSHLPSGEGAAPEAVVDLTDGAPTPDPAVDLASSSRTSLFGGAVDADDAIGDAPIAAAEDAALEATDQAAEAATDGDSADGDSADVPPATRNLRPGLFGR